MYLLSPEEPLWVAKLSPPLMKTCCDGWLFVDWEDTWGRVPLCRSTGPAFSMTVGALRETLCSATRWLFGPGGLTRRKCARRITLQHGVGEGKEEGCYKNGIHV